MKPTDPEYGRCDHFQPADFVDLAEKHLRENQVSPETWEGMRFAWGGQLTESPKFKSLSMELIRRDGQWVLCAINRNLDPLPPDQLGLRIL